MNAIIQFFESVSGFISSGVDFVVGLITDMISLFRILGQAAAKIPQILTVLPAPVTALLLIGLAVAVLYKILGREG